MEKWMITGEGEEGEVFVVFRDYIKRETTFTDKQEAEAQIRKLSSEFPQVVYTLHTITESKAFPNSRQFLKKLRELLEEYDASIAYVADATRFEHGDGLEIRIRGEVLEGYDYLVLRHHDL